MNTNDTDDKLRRLFQEQRRQDELNTPILDVIIRKPLRSSFTLIRWRIAVITVIMFVLVISLPVIIKMKTHLDQIDLTQWELLSDWQASTDSLLVVSNTPWGSKVVTSTDSWLSTESLEFETFQ